MSDAGDWLLFSYSVPKNPSTVRVALWRRLRDLGVLYIAPSVCLLPASAGRAGSLEACRQIAFDAGGTARLLPIHVADAEANGALIEEFRALRAAEYGELLERAEAMLTELSRESEGGKFIFAELEENEDELEKLEKWHKRIAARDVLGSFDKEPSSTALQRCRDALALFRDTTVAREMDFEERGTGTVRE